MKKNWRRTILSMVIALSLPLTGGMAVYAADDIPDPDIAVSASESKTVTYDEEIPFETKYIEDDTQFDTYRVVKREGIPGVLRIKENPSQVAKINGTSIIEKTVIQEPVDEIIVVGTKISEVSRSLDQDDFINPLEAGYISNGYGGYHKGVDIAAPKGTSILAAASGRVSLVKYGNTGYGYYLKVDHGNGVETLYAHNSEILVEEGEWVEQGQEIAEVGCTGRSTGNHLQFEIRLDGKTVNPQSYI